MVLEQIREDIMLSFVLGTGLKLYLWKRKENLYETDVRRKKPNNNNTNNNNNNNNNNKTQPTSLERGNRERRRKRSPVSLKPIRLGLETSHKNYSVFEGSLCCYHLRLHSLGYGRSTSYHRNWKTFILLALCPFAVTKGQGSKRPTFKLFTVANLHYQLSW